MKAAMLIQRMCHRGVTATDDPESGSIIEVSEMHRLKTNELPALQEQRDDFRSKHSVSSTLYSQSLFIIISGIINRQWVNFDWREGAHC